MKASIVARKAILTFSLILILAVPIQGFDSEGGRLRLLSLDYPSSVDAGQAAIVKATILHSEFSIPTLTLYYTYFLNQTILAGGWKMAKMSLNYTDGVGSSLYMAEVPNPAYGEAIPYNSKIIFYLEVKDPLEGTLLTCDSDTRWNAFIQFDKYAILVVDESAPEILTVKQTPKNPTEIDSVTIAVEVVDEASGIASVNLHYWMGEVERVEAMELTSEGFYATVIPSQLRGVEVTYYIVAVDNAGNKAFSEPYSYIVAVSPLLQSYQAKRALTYLIIAAIAILVLALTYLWRKGVKLGGVKPVECKHPKAMTFFMLIAFALAGVLYYHLNQLGSPLVGLLTAIAVVASWGILDPRASTLIPVKLRLDENPPLTLTAEGWIIAIIGALAILAPALVGLYRLNYAYQLAVLLGKYAVGLMTSGLILQLAWPWLKEVEVSIEVEEE